ncbi:hypothetical protein [Actinomycetospora sp. NBRC 106378]|uniref:hypothetical protein n=1 Tax=Actinomycetospora sp. NBRC 106378 TaxID=3032208 RepID=UPI0024A35F35|nr:hypothetical protein [Actinomycetospora sp. NBRC 106378]GLZ51685.1 hypothetical protein Acsp07_13020 [Actinomycetospora sp. NBRC 106378]
MTTPPANGPFGAAVASALRGRFEGVYVNPVGVIIVPFGTTHVAVTSEPVGDLTLVTMRAPILQDLAEGPALFRHVALEATMFKLGSLYLYAEGDGFDLDFETRTFDHWVPPEDVPDILPIVGNTAQEQAADLQPRFGGRVPYPSGAAKRRLFAEEALRRNSAVSDVLDRALTDAHSNRTAIMGAAEGAWLSPSNDVLGSVVFAMTHDRLWLAGWSPRDSRPQVWRYAYSEIADDQVRRDGGATDYLARLRDGRWLGVRMIEAAAAEAMVDVRADPRTYL